MKWCPCTRTSLITIRRSSNSAVSNGNLNRLPKAPAIRSIRFKRTTPGIAARFLLAHVSTPLVDSSHPLARHPQSKLWHVVPRYQCSLFSMHLYPNALLNRFEDPHFFRQLKDAGISHETHKLLGTQTGNQSGIQAENSSDSLFSQAMSSKTSSGDRRRAAHTLPMSTIFVGTKKNVHKSAVVRTRIKMRLREALSLVVVRGATIGADTSTLPDLREVALTTPKGITKEDIEEALIVQGWTYVIRPSLEVYRCPWPSLLENVRKALASIKSQAVQLDRKWKAEKSGQRPYKARAINLSEENRISSQKPDTRGNLHRKEKVTVRREQVTNNLSPGEFGKQASSYRSSRPRQREDHTSPSTSHSQKPARHPERRSSGGPTTTPRRGAGPTLENGNSSPSVDAKPNASPRRRRE